MHVQNYIKMNYSTHVNNNPTIVFLQMFDCNKSMPIMHQYQLAP